MSESDQNEPKHHFFKKGDPRTIKAARKGGRATAKKIGKKGRIALPDEVPGPPETLEDVRRWASWVTHAVATGVIDSDTGRVVTQTLAELRRVIEKSEIERLARENARLLKELKQERRGR